MSKPPLIASLTWKDDLRFDAVSGSASMVLDGDGAAGPSPMQALALALAGCMAIDVVDILRKGRHPLTGLRASLVGERASGPPSRFTRITLAYTLGGAVPREAVARAIALSREKYCSVWHSLRQDIDFEATFEIVPGEPQAAGAAESR